MSRNLTRCTDYCTGLVLTPGLLGLGLGLEAKFSGLGLETSGLGLEAFGLGLVFLALAWPRSKPRPRSK